MITLLLAMWLAGEALAQESEDSTPAPSEDEVPVEQDAAPAGRDFDKALQTALDLERAGEPHAARAVAGWVSMQPDVGPSKADADALAARLPDGPSLVGSKVRLIAFEAAAGAWLLGANPAFNERFGDAEGAYYVGALVGGGAGTLGAIAWMRRPTFDADRYDALVGSQQLGAYNLAMLLAPVDVNSHSFYTLVPAGIAVGALGGTGLGLLWAERGPHPVAPVAMRSGMFWGLGLTVAGLSYTYAWDDLSDEAIPRILLAGSDLGAAVGLALPHFLPVTREQVRFANLGGVVGGAAAYFFVSTTADLIWYMPHDVALVVGGAGLAGGALGVVLATRLEHVPEVPVADAMFRTEGGRLRVAVPVPRPMVLPGAEPRLGLGLSFVDQTF